LIAQPAAGDWVTGALNFIAPAAGNAWVCPGVFYLCLLFTGHGPLHYTGAMPELTPEHIAVLERLRDAGFTLAAFPMYASHVGVRKGNCAALLAPATGGRMQLFGEPCYLVNGSLSVRVRREGRKWFVWKKTQLEATPERLAELTRFREELASLL
jgi:hypothetical protein